MLLSGLAIYQGISKIHIHEFVDVVCEYTVYLGDEETPGVSQPQRQIGIPEGAILCFESFRGYG